MNHEKYKAFIQFEIDHDRVSKFGFYEDIEDFDILNVAILYDKDKPDEDEIKFDCEYNQNDSIYSKTIHRYKRDYENYLIQLRDNKLKELGIK